MQAISSISNVYTCHNITVYQSNNFCICYSLQYRRITKGFDIVIIYRQEQAIPTNKKWLGRSGRGPHATKAAGKVFFEVISLCTI